MIKYLCHSLFIALLVIFPIKDSTAQEKVERETKIRSTTVSLLNESYNSINREEGWDGEAIKIKGTGREIRIFRNLSDEPPELVIYMQDGQATYEFFEALEYYLKQSSYDLPSYAIVGIYSTSDRMGEYLNRKSNNEAYKRYSKLFINSIVPSIEKHLKPKAPFKPNQRVLAGFSNGGAWSISFSLDFPKFANQVIALSPGGPLPDISNPELYAKSKFTLGYGKEEDRFSKHAQNIATILQNKSLDVNVITWSGGHETSTWVPIFIQAIIHEFATQASP